MVLAVEALKKRLRGVEGTPVYDYPDPEAMAKRALRDLKKCVNLLYPKDMRHKLLTIQRHSLLQVRFMCVCMCVCLYMCVYTHKHARTQFK